MLPSTVIQSWVEGRVTIPYINIWKICELLNLECDEVVRVK